VLKRWKRKFGPEIYEVISSLIEIEEDIIDYVGEAPGIDEEFMLDYLISLAETEKYQHLVWDTAPTGYTLRLLTLPIRFINHLNSATRVYLKLDRYLKRIKSQRSIFDIIKSWKILAEKVIHFLQDPQQMEAVIVTIPETLGFSQTEKIMAEFEKHRLHFRHLIVNYLVENPEGDFLKKKKDNQQEILRAFRKRYQEKLKLIELPLFPEEIKGLLKVEEFSKLLIKRWGGEG
jgi:arsenite-transporting ATPase